MVYVAHLSVIPGRPVNTCKHLGIVMAVHVTNNLLSSRMNYEALHIMHYIN